MFGCRPVEVSYYVWINELSQSSLKIYCFAVQLVLITSQIFPGTNEFQKITEKG